MEKTLSKEQALLYIIENANKYNIPKAYIGADYLDGEKKIFIQHILYMRSNHRATNYISQLQK